MVKNSIYRLFLEDVQAYLLQKPYVRSIGDANILEFAPLHEAAEPTRIEKCSRPAYEMFEKAASEESTGILKEVSGIFKHDRGTAHLYLDFPMKPERGRTVPKTSQLSAGLIEGLDAITARDFLEEGEYRSYVELAMKKRLAEGIAAQYGMHLLISGSGLLLTLVEPAKLGDLDHFLEATTKYLRQSCSSAFREEILKNAARLPF